MFRHFRTNNRGGVATMVGVSFGVLALAAGGAVDYSHATSKRHGLQKAADASVLAAASMADATDDERMDHASKMFLGSKFCEKYPCERPSTSMDGTAIVLQGASSVETSILQIAGLSKIDLGVTSRAIPAVDEPLDVMMILDYSGSMGGSKYQDMAAAAQQFIEGMENQPGDNMAVGVVPFSKYVLTPMRGQYLFDVAAGNNLSGQTYIGCILNREHPYSTNADTPSNGVQGSQWPVFSYTTGSSPSSGDTFSDPPASLDGYTHNTWTYNNPDTGEEMTFEVSSFDNDPGSTINGVVAEYMMPGYTGMNFNGNGRYHLVYHNSPTGHPGGVHTLGPPPKSDPFATFGGYAGSTGWTLGDDSGLPTVFDQAKLAESLGGSCGQYATNHLWVRPLSQDFAELKTAIGQMRPIGLTNIALGLDIGWHALTPSEPFSEANTEQGTQKVAILLTDGVQTVAAHGTGGNVSVGSANTNVAESCEAMKAENIEIFTIAFAINDTYTRDLLKACATSPPHYFEPTAGGDLDAVFEGIFAKVTSGRVRLTQ